MPCSTSVFGIQNRFVSAHDATSIFVDEMDAVEPVGDTRGQRTRPRLPSIASLENGSIPTTHVTDSGIDETEIVEPGSASPPWSGPRSSSVRGRHDESHTSTDGQSVIAQPSANGPPMVGVHKLHPFPVEIHRSRGKRVPWAVPNRSSQPDGQRFTGTFPDGQTVQPVPASVFVPRTRIGSEFSRPESRCLWVTPSPDRCRRPPDLPIIRRVAAGQVRDRPRTSLTSPAPASPGPMASKVREPEEGRGFQTVER